MDPEEFTGLLRTVSLEQVVRDHIFTGLPFVFEESESSFDLMREHLEQQLDVRRENVIVIGSAKLGFSLSPDTFPRSFSDESDIDVLIVDEDLFDLVWSTMLRWNYPRRFRLSGIDWEWSKDRINDLYWGWFVPSKIRFEGLSFPSVLTPLRDLSTRWFNAFQGLSRFADFASRTVSGRLYRTWDHALLYHVDSLGRVRQTLAAQGG